MHSFISQELFSVPAIVKTSTSSSHTTFEKAAYESRPRCHIYHPVIIELVDSQLNCVYKHGYNSWETNLTVALFLMVKICHRGAL